MCARANRTIQVDPELGELTLDRLTRDVWLWQRKSGHRFSVDDVVTAFVAARRRPDARRICDLGCGLGSVLLHLAWSLPEAIAVGLEAQAVSHALALRNIAHNHLEARVSAHPGDLREPVQLRALGARFDLVTGTPPYFPPSHALDAEDEQRAYARIEYRGGVEAYIHAGASLLGPGGELVLCGDARAEERVLGAAATTRLHLVHRTEVVARAPAPPLFVVWVLAAAPAPPTSRTLVIRDASGERTADAEELRRFSGIP